MTEPNYERYKAYLDDLNHRQMSNSDTYDKSLLALSSAFLGLSLTFIQNVVPLDSGKCLYLLYLSWGFFSLTVILTIFSFMYGQAVIDEFKEGAKRYFIEGNQEEDTRSQVLSKRLTRLNAADGLVFIVGVVSLVVFVGLNVAG